MTDIHLLRGDRYANAYEDYIKGNISQKEYEDFLSKQDEDSYVGFFFRAKYSISQKDNNHAKEYIDKSVYLFENRNRVINSAEDLINDDDLALCLPIFNLYQLAAEIHAMCKDCDNALLFYQKSQYYLSQLDSGFNNVERGGVYSFRPVSRYALSDLISNSITVARPLQMNDPFDSLFTFWASKENLMKTCEEQNHIDPFLESFNSYRIRSFVGNKTLTMDDKLVGNIIMWSHYADAHKGYCIRYRLSKHFIKKPDDGTFKHNYLREVNYVLGNERVNVVCSSMNTERLFTTKSTQWSGESEIRLVNYDASYDGDFLQLKLDDCSTIEAIYFGYRCSDTDQRDIMSIVGDKAEYYKMEFDPTNVYSMIINKISFNPSSKPNSESNVEKLIIEER